MKIYWNGESKNIISPKIRALRTDRNWTQKELAAKMELAGIPFSDLAVLRIEAGDRFVPDYEVIALTEYFHVSCEYLLGIHSQK